MGKAEDCRTFLLRMINHDERQFHGTLIHNLRPYIFAAKKALGIEACQLCGGLVRLEIHHVRYAPDITLYDLQILCRSCHRKQTVRNRRMANADNCLHCRREC